MKMRIHWLVIGLIAIGAVILALVATRRGPNLNQDSAFYIAGARNLAAGRGFVNYTLRPITIFAPGLSITLALGDRLGLDAVEGARFLNAIAFGGLVILTFVLARRHSRRISLAVAAAAAVGFAPPLLDVFTRALTEPVFCVLVVGLLITLESLLIKCARDPYLVALAGFLASVGFAYRYAGVTLLALSVLIVGVAARHDGLGAIVRRTILCLTVSLVVPALIIARNLSTGPALGPRRTSVETLRGIASELNTTSKGWVSAQQSLPLNLGDVALVAAIVIVIVGFVIAVRKVGFEGHALEAAALLPVAVFVGGYLLYVVISEMQTNIDPIGNRLLSPIFAPAVVLVVIAADQLLDLGWITSRRWIVHGTAVLVVLWLVGSLGVSARNARRHGESGQGYASPSWMQSDLAAAVRSLPARERIYSNVPDGFYFAAAKQPIYDSPAAHPYRSNAKTQKLSAFREEVRHSPQGIYLVWRTPNPRTNLVTRAQLRQNGLRLELVSHLKDGSIYRVTML